MILCNGLLYAHDRFHDRCLDLKIHIVVRFERNFMVFAANNKIAWCIIIQESVEQFYQENAILSVLFLEIFELIMFIPEIESVFHLHVFVIVHKKLLVAALALCLKRCCTLRNIQMAYQIQL
jgi:hypothetical protein